MAKFVVDPLTNTLNCHEYLPLCVYMWFEVKLNHQTWQERELSENSGSSQNPLGKNLKYQMILPIICTGIHPFHVKEIFSDFHNIFLWYESEDINQKSLFPKFQMIPILRLIVFLVLVFYYVPLFIKCILLYRWCNLIQAICLCCISPIFRFVLYICFLLFFMMEINLNLNLNLNVFKMCMIMCGSLLP